LAKILKDRLIHSDHVVGDRITMHVYAQLVLNVPQMVQWIWLHVHVQRSPIKKVKSGIMFWFFSHKVNSIVASDIQCLFNSSILIPACIQGQWHWSSLQEKLATTIVQLNCACNWDDCFESLNILTSRIDSEVQKNEHCPP